MSTIERRVFRRLGLRRRIVGQVSQLDVQLALIRNGLGTLAESAPGLRAVELVEPDITLEVSLAARAPGRPTRPPSSCGIT